jgi:uncharacterized protein (DUF427 family)
MKAMKLPDADHPISITPAAGRVIVRFAGQIIADSRAALTLKEANYPAVQYLPRADARMSALQRTSHQSFCPYKGDASYYSLRVDDQQAENAVWSYEQPFPAMAAIEGYLAFYPNRVESIEVKE